MLQVIPWIDICHLLYFQNELWLILKISRIQNAHASLISKDFFNFSIIICWVRLSVFKIPFSWRIKMNINFRVLSNHVERTIMGTISVSLREMKSNLLCRRKAFKAYFKHYCTSVVTRQSFGYRSGKLLGSSLANYHGNFIVALSFCSELLSSSMCEFK